MCTTILNLQYLKISIASLTYLLLNSISLRVHEYTDPSRISAYFVPVAIPALIEIPYMYSGTFCVLSTNLELDASIAISCCTVALNYTILSCIGFKLIPYLVLLSLKWCHF